MGSEPVTHAAGDELETAAIVEDEAPRQDGRLHLRSGERIARYVVLEEIGTGSMGEVYSAYDPELDRRVAVKLLRRRSSRGAKALLREAQAMAKLTHPNVVAIHDVGTIELELEHGPQLFIAMEFVEGWTLRQWWSEQPRSWSEIVERFVQAGRGLAAAHAARLVHRDFKPDNVLVGKDGRVRVTDFGLARPAHELALDERRRSQGTSAADSTAGASTSASASAVSQTGAASSSSLSLGRASVDEEAEPEGPVELLPPSRWHGTPAYMAPEQFCGGTIDQLSDQFSFCISLFEALYGARPFTGSTPKQIGEQVCAGDMIAPLEDVEVPRRVVDVVLRGLSVRRRDRFENMDALLRALDPPAPKRGGLILGLGLGLGLVAALAVGAWVQSRPSPDPCAGVGDEIDELWTPQRRRDLEEAIVATQSPGAVETAERVTGKIQAYVDSWRSMRRRSCVEHGESEELDQFYRRRVACLDDRRGRLAAQLEVYRDLDPRQVPHLVEAVSALPPIDACGDLEQLAQGFDPHPEQLRTTIAGFERRLDRVEALYRSSAYAKARSTLDPVLPAIAELDYEPLSARAKFWDGRIAMEQSDGERAEQSLRAAWFSALAAGDDVLAVRSAAALVRTVGVLLSRPEDGREWAAHGRALARRLGEHAATAQLINSEGVLASRTGDLDGAIELMAEVLELRSELFDADDIRVGRAHTNLAAILLSAHRYEESLPHHREAIRIVRTQFGPTHVDNATTHLNYGLTLMNLRREDEAREHLEAAMAVLDDRDEPADEATRALIHNGLGELDGRAGDWLEARAHFEAMHETFAELLGEEHSYTANASVALAAARARLGELDEALASLEAALAYCEGHEVPGEELANTRAELAIALWIQGRDRARARDEFERAMDLLEAEGLDASPVIEAWLADHPEILEHPEQ